MRPLAQMVSAAILVLAAAPCAPTAEPRGQAVRIRRPSAAAAVERALAGARRRLERRECQAVFTVFRDREGRPLAERVQELTAAGDDVLGRLLFYDGRDTNGCRDGRRLATIQVGARVVFVCEAFEWAARRNPLLAEAALIHESLHSLGLGENPPTSQEITSRVITACSG